MIEIPDWADTIGDTELIAFVKARLAEDEAAAEAAASVAGPDWTWTTDVHRGEATDYITTPDGALLADTMGGSDGDMAAHVALHDPARAMREVEAKHRHLDQYRMAVAACQLAPAGEARGLESYRAAAWGAVLSDAAVWSDHPEYKAKWKP